MVSALALGVVIALQSQPDCWVAPFARGLTTWNGSTTWQLVPYKRSDCFFTKNKAMLNFELQETNEPDAMIVTAQGKASPREGNIASLEQTPRGFAHQLVPVRDEESRVRRSIFLKTPDVSVEWQGDDKSYRVLINLTNWQKTFDTTSIHAVAVSGNHILIHADWLFIVDIRNRTFTKTPGVDGIAFNVGGGPVYYRRIPSATGFAKATDLYSSDQRLVRRLQGDWTLGECSLLADWFFGTVTTKGHFGEGVHFQSGGGGRIVMDNCDFVVSRRWRAYWSRSY